MEPRCQVDISAIRHAQDLNAVNEHLIEYRSGSSKGRARHPTYICRSQALLLLLTPRSMYASRPKKLPNERLTETWITV